MIVWVDLETTGLDPEHGLPLEVALVITNDNLEPFVEYSSPIRQRSIDLVGSMNAEIKEMHANSGLLDELDDAPSQAQVEFNMIDTYHMVTNDPWPLAGSTVFFDRIWLMRHFPNFSTLLHYRNIDVSSFKELNMRTGFAPLWEKKGIHRALPDILDSIEELKSYKRAIFSVKAQW